MKNKNHNLTELNQRSLSQFKRTKSNQWITDVLFGAGISSCFIFMISLI